MKFGVCTWTFGNQPLDKTAAVLVEIGIDGVELLGDLNLYSAQEAAQILGDHGLKVFSLTPGDVDISHPDAAVRQTAVDYYRQLIDFAAELGQPMVSCHGLVGRIAPISSMAEENGRLLEVVHEIGEYAQQNSINLVFEVLNRYETHQINTHIEAIALLERLNLSNVGVLLDAYHMNIEEADPAEAIKTTGKHLWLYHAADSNRAGVGYGHTDFAAQLDALNTIGYNGPVIFECTAPGPNPFTPEKQNGWRDILKTYIQDSLVWFQEHATD
ncbi:MAG: sugar phosphate isomerase/epimerase [Chloroflexi bacterium]|nr:sugar phosphate isomerase/epimerase [Chloroflexota bacterium]